MKKNHYVYIPTYAQVCMEADAARRRAAAIEGGGDSLPRRPARDVEQEIAARAVALMIERPVDAAAAVVMLAAAVTGALVAKPDTI